MDERVKMAIYMVVLGVLIFIIVWAGVEALR